MPVRNPATAGKKYTPATVDMKRLTQTSSISLLTNPQYSQILRPVIRAKRSTIALGCRKHETIQPTKSTPVMVLMIRFFCLSVMAFGINYYRPACLRHDFRPAFLQHDFR